MPTTLEQRPSRGSFNEDDDEDIEDLKPLSPSQETTVVQASDESNPPPGTITPMGLKVLVLLAVQNCSKNLLMRFIMKDKPKFLTSVAVIGVELIKLILSVLYILLIDKRSISTIVTFMKDDHKNSMLLAVPAAAYSFQMSMEYVALANIDAAVFSVLVQTKLLATASFAVIIMRKKIRKAQVISLVLLTVGVMLCNMKDIGGGNNVDENEAAKKYAEAIKGITATLGIALSSGFASVYTEKVIKAQRNRVVASQNYSLAYMQFQLAIVSLVILVFYAGLKDFETIWNYGVFYQFSFGAFVSMFNSAIGGLIVAAVLKYADAVLKGYATAISVIMTGVLSMLLFGTTLNAPYFMGITNVICAVLLYNARDLDRNMCEKEEAK
jgi:solute carrier family 35 (UDP-sugar transporter), member A1/2/3